MSKEKKYTVHIKAPRTRRFSHKSSLSVPLFSTFSNTVLLIDTNHHMKLIIYVTAIFGSVISTEAFLNSKPAFARAQSAMNMSSPSDFVKSEIAANDVSL